MKSYWPDDADGDVMRQLEASGFEFDVEHAIDFNIDFEKWPPSQQFIDQLKATYPVVEINPPEGDSAGDVRFFVEAKLSYELVKFVQESVSAIAKPYGGWCESWGVLH
ncbi:MAG: ribonuclease E inhibitor RraB [Pseudomonadota bacterium]